MNNPVITEFEIALHQLAGKTCWNVQAGAVGSMASLHIGDKIPLDKPLPYPNTSLTPDEHKFRGEYMLYVEDCPWRIEDGDSVQVTWLENSSAVTAQMKALIGRIVERVELTRPGMDLALFFSGGIALRIFPDQADPEEGDNYSLSVRGDMTYIVAAHSTVYVE